MAKLNIFEKEAYSINMEVAKEEGITFLQSDDKRITVAVQSHDTMRNYMRVYIAYCGNETPKKKRGISAVMNRYFNTNFILFPAMFGDNPTDYARRIMNMVEETFY